MVKTLDGGVVKTLGGGVLNGGVANMGQVDKHVLWIVKVTMDG